MLGGIGSIGNLVVSSSGVLAPGLGGVGTLTAASVILSNGSILDDSIGVSGQNTMLAVTGGLMLGSGGTLNILPTGPLPVGTYVLAAAGSISGSPSGWTVTGLPAPAVLAITGGTLSLSYTAMPVSGMWNSAAGGSWSTVANWQNRWEPNFAGDSATFGASIGSSAATVTLDGGHTLSALSFSTTGGGSYTISTSSGDTTSALTLSNGVGTATVTNSGGNQTVAVPIVLGSNLAVNALAGSLTFSGPISESSTGTNLTVGGGGTVILSGSNTFSGWTAIAGGTLQIGSGGTVGSINGTSAVTDNGILAFDLAKSTTFSQTITGSGGVTQMGSGVLRLTGGNSYSGPTTIAPAPSRREATVPWVA